MERATESQHRPWREVSAAIRMNSGISKDGSRIFKRKRKVHGGGISSWLSVGLLLYLSADGVSAQLPQEYCSSQNTGADHYIGSDEWMTLGWCKDRCVEYAFGVVQGYKCWCSDYAPNSSNSKTDCVVCPQYNLEKCGNSKTGSYGYVDAGNAPKGTADASSKPVSSTKTTASSTTVSDPKISTSSSRETTSSPPTKASSTIIVIKTTVYLPNDSASTTHTTPWVSVITVDGPPRTVTFTPSGWTSPTADTSLGGSNSGDGNFFDNAGRVAGVFTVLALLLVALIFALFWYMRHRKQKGTPLSADSPTPEGFGGGSMMIGGLAQEKRRSRSMSTLGLTTPYASDRPNLPPPIVTTNSGSSGGSAGIPPMTSDRITDQRLDPGQVWMRFENDNASRMSVRSLRDDQDYSRRVLRLANPDED